MGLDLSWRGGSSSWLFFVGSFGSLTIQCSFDVMALKKRVNPVMRHARCLQRLHERSIFLYAALQPMYPVHDAPELFLERPY